MPILADCHMHSSFSGDSKAPMEDMIKQAISLGLKEICFTEHQDFDFIYNDDEPKDMFNVNTDSYLYDLIKYKEKYRSQISVSFGVELGMQAHLSRKLVAYAKNYDFDFIIASSHLCNRKDPYFPSFYEGRPEEEAYHEYFSYIRECLKSYLNFDVYGHLDYILRYGPTKNQNFVFAKYQEDIDAILTVLIDNEKGIEVNSSGYSHGLNNPHPCKDILMRYKALGGSILTIGSDAHKPENIAKDYDKVASLLTECGFTHYCVFKNRMPEYLKL